jgi:hypothetical protein
VTLTFHVLWMLCALGAAIFAAVPSPSWRHVAALAAGFAASATWWSADRLPDSAAIGLLALIVSGVVLLRPARAALGVFVGGVLAGAWSALLEAQGAPVVAAVGGAALVPAASMWLSARRQQFLPGRIHEEALLGTLAGGLVVATLPGVLDGWRAALNLNLQGGAASSAGAEPAVPAWTVIMGAAALGGGALYSLWSRR